MAVYIFFSTNILLFRSEREGGGERGASAQRLQLLFQDGGQLLQPHERLAHGDAAQVLGEAGSLIRNVSLFAVLIYELVGPLLTKIALTKAGEIVPKAVAVTDEEDDE